MEQLVLNTDFHKKVAIFIFLVFSFVYASVTSVGTPSPTLYQNTNDPDVYVDVGLKFTHTMQLSVPANMVISGAANDLGNNAEICTGASVTISDSISGKWANDGDFYAYTYAPFGCPDPNFEVLHDDQSMSWNKNNYNALKDLISCFAWDDTCWGKEGSLKNQRIDVYEITPAISIVNRQGKVNTLCTGEDDPLVKKGGVNYNNPAPKETTGATSFSYSVALNQIGTYAFESQFKVKGCVVSIRYPTCNDERIYGRTSPDGPEYSFNVQKNTLNIKVSNPNADIDKVNVPPGSDPLGLYSTSFDMEPGADHTAKIKVKNNGNVAVKVTGVSATNGFTTVPISGFNQNIAPAAEKDLTFILHAPAGLPEGQSATQISLAYETLGPVCGQPKIEETLDVTYTINPDGDCDCDPATPLPECADCPPPICDCIPGNGIPDCDDCTVNCDCIPDNGISDCENCGACDCIPGNGIPDCDDCTVNCDCIPDNGISDCENCGACDCDPATPLPDCADCPPGGCDCDPTTPLPDCADCGDNNCDCDPATALPNCANCPPNVGDINCTVIPHYVYLHPNEEQTFDIRCSDKNGAEVGYSDVTWMPPAGFGLFNLGTGTFRAVSMGEGQVGAEVTFGANQNKAAVPATVKVIELMCIDVV